MRNSNLDVQGNRFMWYSNLIAMTGSLEDLNKHFIYRSEENS